MSELGQVPEALLEIGGAGRKSVEAAEVGGWDAAKEFVRDGWLEFRSVSYDDDGEPSATTESGRHVWRALAPSKKLLNHPESVRLQLDKVMPQLTAGVSQSERLAFLVGRREQGWRLRVARLALTAPLDLLDLASLEEEIKDVLECRGSTPSLTPTEASGSPSKENEHANLT